MNRLLYVVYSVGGAVALLVGALMIATSIEDENTYWLIFGIALVTAALLRLQSVEARRPD